MHPFLSELLRNFKDDAGSKERHLRDCAGHAHRRRTAAALGISDGKWPPLARASSSSLGKAGRCAFWRQRPRRAANEYCAVGDDLEGGPPGARGYDVLAFEARVAALWAARRRSTRRGGNACLLGALNIHIQGGGGQGGQQGRVHAKNAAMASANIRGSASAKAASTRGSSSMT